VMLEIPDGFAVCLEHGFVLMYELSAEYENRCPLCVVEDDFDHMVVYLQGKLKECMDACT